MTAAATIPSQATPGDPPAWEALRGVEIFDAGNWDGSPLGAITEADLDDAVRNFSELRGRIDPTAWAGHEDDYRSTGLPAFGHPVALRRVGTKLVADLDYVPADVAALIKARRFRKVSAEFYPPGHKATGRPSYVLKHVAFLGAHQPAVKTLAPVPEPTPSDAPHWPSVLKTVSRNFAEDGAVRFFSEVRPMKTRAELESLLKELGYTDEDVTLYKALPDDALAGFVARQQARDQERKAAAAKNEAAAREAAAKAAAEEAARKATPPVPVPPVEAAVAEAVRNFAEQAVAPVKAELAAIRQQYQSEQHLRAVRDAQERKSAVDAACARLLKEGRVSPAQVEPGRGPVRLRLEKADAVRKFSDQPSELEAELAMLESFPARRFGEQLPDPLDAGRKQVFDQIREAGKTAHQANGDKPTLESVFGLLPPGHKS